MKCVIGTVAILASLAGAGIAQAQPYGPPPGPPPGPGYYHHPRGPMPPPPPERFRPRPPGPYDRFAWVPGHYVWTGYQYVWHGGHWRPRRY